MANCTLSPESNWVLCCGGPCQSTFQMHFGRECTLQCSDWKQHFFPPRASISAKAWKYDTGRTKIVWGLHLLISTYFPPAFQAPISLCVKTDTTHFKVTRSPTHKKGPKRYRTSSPVGQELSQMRESIWNSEHLAFLKCDWWSESVCKS